MTTKKQLLQNNEIFKQQIADLESNSTKLKQQVDFFKDWYTSTDISRAASVLSANVRASIGADETDINNTIYNQIQSQQLPSQMSWDFWRYINQWTDRRMNRYEISCGNQEQLESILIALRIGILYGSAAITKNNEVGYVQKVGNKYYFYSDNYALNYSFGTLVNNDGMEFKIADKAVKNRKEILRDDFAYFSWRFGNVGDFVWWMKELLTMLYLKKIIEVNCSQLNNKLWYEVRNQNTLATEIAINTDPFKNFALVINDTQTGTTLGANKIINDKTQKPDPYIDSLITAFKHHEETWFNWAGLQITSSKNQSLSSDHNLSVGNAEHIAKEHDKRVEFFINEINEKLQWNVCLDIDNIEPEDLVPENQNADKEGEGHENTTMDDIEEKA